MCDGDTGFHVPDRAVAGSRTHAAVTVCAMAVLKYTDSVRATIRQDRTPFHREKGTGGVQSHPPFVYIFPLPLPLPAQGARVLVKDSVKLKCRAKSPV